MLLFIKSLTGESLTVEVEENTTCGEIKKQISNNSIVRAIPVNNTKGKPRNYFDDQKTSHEFIPNQ